MRDQLAALFGIVLLIPTAIGMDLRMAAILIELAAAYTLMNVAVMRRTASGQAAVERHEQALSSRVVDVDRQRYGRPELCASPGRGGRLTRAVE